MDKCEFEASLAYILSSRLARLHSKTVSQEIKNFKSWQWCRTPLTSALGRQRPVGLFEFKVTLIYRASSRAARATQRNPVSITTIIAAAAGQAW